jgi:hypothetical protein
MAADTISADTLAALHGLLQATASEPWETWEALTRPALADLLGDSGDSREKFVRGTRVVHRGEYYEAHVPDAVSAPSARVGVFRSEAQARQRCRRNILYLLTGGEFPPLYPVTADAE